MTQLRLVADHPAPNSKEDLIVNEQAWRPIRSLMAIANQKFVERDGSPLVRFDCLEDIDDNTNHGIDGDACYQMAEMMSNVLEDPFAICDYGMTVDISDGETTYTYPTNMCTAYFEDVENGKFFESLDSPGIVGRRVRSWFKTTEPEMQLVINFLRSCGGFKMP